MARYYKPSFNRNAQRSVGHRPEVSLRPQPENYYLTQQRRNQRLAETAVNLVVAPPAPEIETALEFGNKELPAYRKKEEFLQLIAEHRAMVVVGPTGSGKSTQIPQFLFEAGYDVTLTQPRIMAANCVGERIEDELASVMGRLGASDAVGVHTSEKDTTGPETRVRIVTDGLKLAQIMGAEGNIADEVIVIDEVHEWNANIELAVAAAKRLLQERPNLRVVLMSATVEAHKIANYFADASGDLPPVLEIEGRSHPVERHEEPGSTIVEQAILHADRVGSMLLFVPGLREIEDTMDELRRRLPSTIAKSAVLLPLHAKMSKREQDRVMQVCEGLKIIVATNVAQTSLTIPGVDLVLDTGLERRIEMDEEEIMGLELHPCSQAEMDQRAGRTGRDCPGVYIHTRYDAETEFVPYMNRPQYSTPEIWRTDVSRSVLRSAVYGVDFSDLDLFHPVEQSTVRRAKDMLYQLGAFDEDDRITGIGEYMNKFPLRPTLGRMMYQASPHSERIRAYVAAMTASVEAGGLQRFGHEIDTRWRKLLSDHRESDLISQLDIFIKLQRLQGEGKLTEWYMREHDLDVKNVNRALTQYQKIARRAGVFEAHTALLPPSEEEREIITECIFAGLADYAYMRAGSDRGRATFRPLGIEGDPRQVSNRSIVDKPTRMVVGQPYRVEVSRGGDKIQIGIIEQVTNIPEPQVLARVAMHLCKYTDTQFIWHGDELLETAELSFHGEVPLGLSRRQKPEWTNNVREAHIHQMFERQGSFMKDLLALKRKHEKVARRTKEELPVITQGTIERWLYDVTAQPASSLGEIDSRLRLHAMERLHTFVSDEKQTELYKEAPDEVTTSSGRTLQLSYSHGAPTAKGNFTPAELAALGNSCRIPRGDEIKFYVEIDGHRRAKTLMEIEQLAQLV